MRLPILDVSRSHGTAVPPAPPPKLGRRPVLDGLRGIAVMLVMLEHTGLIHNGFMGVDIFFALSGFLITTLLYEEWERDGRISLRGFYARRARRLLPALLMLVGAFTVIYLVAAPFTGWPVLPRDATTLLFVNNWIAGFGHSADLGALNPTWSLAQEEQFYLLWPLALCVLLRRRVPPVLVVLPLLAAIVGLVVAVPAVHGAHPSYSLYFSPLDRGAELLLGCVGAVIWHNRLHARGASWLAGRVGGIDRLRAPECARLRRRALVCAGQLAAATLIVVFVRTLLDVDLADERPVFLAANAIGIAVILLLVDTPRAPLSRLLSVQPLRYLGRISYCLYLCHLLVHNLLVHYLPGHTTDFYAVTTIAIAVAIASLSWTVVESKVLRLSASPRARPMPQSRTPALQAAR